MFLKGRICNYRQISVLLIKMNNKQKGKVNDIIGVKKNISPPRYKIVEIFGGKRTYGTITIRIFPELYNVLVSVVLLFKFLFVPILVHGPRHRKYI